MSKKIRPHAALVHPKKKLNLTWNDPPARPPIPLIMKVRHIIIDALPFVISILYCSESTHAAICNELTYMQRITFNPLTIDGTTIQVLPGTPDGEFIFFPG